MNSKADVCCHWRTSPGSSSKEITSKMYAFLGNTSLDRLFTANSKMFRLHGLNQLLEIMISHHLSKWTEDELFKEGERLAKGLVVVNDMAERGISLIQDFSTRIEKRLGSVSANRSRPLVIIENRQQFPDCTKKIIVVESIASTSSKK